MTPTAAALIFATLSAVVMVFQACLAAGLPWGAASMGGKYPGKYPPKMRVVAVINIVLLGFLAAIVLSRADLLFPQLAPFSRKAIWFVVAFSGIGTVLNSITPSKIERIWAPVVAIQLLTSIFIATN